MSAVEPPQMAIDRLIEANKEMVEQEARKRSLQRKEKRLSDPYRSAMEWMALVPFLTRPLAESAQMPPHPSDVPSTFEELTRRGLVEVREPLRLPVEPKASGMSEPSEAVYTMPGIHRARILDDYRIESASSDAGARFESRLRDLLAEVGGRVLLACRKLPNAPSQIRRWASLARHANDPAAMVGAFDAQVDAAHKAEDAAELLNWIETARPLTAFMNEFYEFGMKPAMERAGRQLELVHRLNADRSHVRVLLPRAEQVVAFNALMKKPERDAEKAPWALHILGNAGVGKTMLLRHITLDLAERVGAFVARIDFDYLNPDFPRLKPGLILWAFARELRAYDETGRANELFDKADLLLHDLHRKLNDTRAESAPDRSTRDDLFIAAVGTYVSAFRALKCDVLLIVDTCEELAKASPDPAAAENVKETFRILRALHDGPQVLRDESLPASAEDGLPGLRVIFAGRRLLASVGSGWHRRMAEGLQERPYLRLHEIRGFTPAEAENYLRLIRKDADGLFLPNHGLAAGSLPSGPVNAVPRELIPAIIKKTSLGEMPDPSVVWDEPDTAPDEGMRCNPFELRDYAEWATAEMPPTATEIEEATSGRYVEHRILRRLGHEPMAATLPVLALLGHFDRETLRRCADVSSARLDELFLKLQQQEWISRHDVSVDGRASGRLVLGIRPSTRWRLRTYFQLKGIDLKQRSARVADYLMDLTTTGHLSQLDWTDFDAAMEVIELQEPLLAAQWWHAVERRLFGDRDAHWVLSVTGAMTGPDGAAGERHSESPGSPTESVLRTAVLATRASASVHADGARAGELWGQVQTSLDRYPDPDVRETFRLRALAGRIAACRSSNRAPEPEVVRELWESARRAAEDLQLAASFVAATEAVVEYAEVLAETDMPAARVLLVLEGGVPTGPRRVAGAVRLGISVHWYGDSGGAPLNKAPGKFDLPARTASFHPDHPMASEALHAFSCTLAARAEVITGDPKSAEPLFLEALQIASELGDAGSTFRWDDWLPPRDIPARVALESLRALYPGVLSNSQALKFVQDWERPPTNPDRERLLSAIVQVQLDRRPTALELLKTTGWVDESRGKLQVPEDALRMTETPCNAHRAISPLYATALECQALNGQADQVLSRLGAINSQARDYSIDVAREAARLAARLARLSRWRDETGSEENALLHGSNADDWGLIWVLDGLDGRKALKPTLEAPSLVPGGPPRWDWLHALWRTSHCGEPLSTSSSDAVAWASDRLETTWRAEPVPWHGSRAAFLRLSLGFDWLEAQALGREPLESVTATQAELRRIGLEVWDEVGQRPADVLTLLLRARALGLSLPRRSSPPPGQTVLSPFESPAEVTAHYLNVLGKRRAARIALDEGELLALRLPAQSLLLLTEARKWFQRCGDWLGVVMAGTSQLLIEIRCGRPRSSRARTFDQVRKAYQKLTFDNSSWSALPPWQTLQTLADAGRVAEFEALRPVVWRPWLIRIIACLSDPRPGVRGRNALEEWLRDNYGTMVENRCELPADLEGWINAPVSSGRANVRFLGRTSALKAFARNLESADIPSPAAPVASPEPSNKPPVRQKRQKESSRVASKTGRTDSTRVRTAWAALVAALLVLIGLLAVGIAIGFVLYSWLDALLRPVASALYKYLMTSGPVVGGSNDDRRTLVERINVQHLLIVVALGAGASALVALSRRRNLSRLLTWLGRKLPSWYGLDFLEVRLKSATVGPPPEVSVSILRWRPSIRLSWQPLYFRSREIGSPTTRQPGTVTYRELNKLAPIALPAESLSLVCLPVTHPLDVVIELDEDLHAPCWEALVEQALGLFESVREVRPIWFRRSGAGRIFRAPSPISVAPLVSLVSGELGASVCSRGWLPSFDRKAGFFPRIVQPDTRLGSVPSLADILIPGRGIPGMDLESVRVLHVIGTAEETPSGTLLRMNWRSVQSQSAEDAIPQSLLISAGEVARLLPNMTVCVIQGEPRLMRAARVEGDRRDANAARAFAGKLYCLGIPVVIVLPPLIIQLAVDSLAEVASTVAARPRFGTRALGRAVATVKRSIATLPDDWELSRDVSLYAPADWDGRISWATTLGGTSAGEESLLKTPA